MAKRNDTGIFLRGKIYWIRYSVNSKQIRESTHSTKREEAKLLLGHRLQEIARGKEPETKKIKNLLLSISSGVKSRGVLIARGFLLSSWSTPLDNCK